MIQYCLKLKCVNYVTSTSLIYQPLVELSQHSKYVNKIKLQHINIFLIVKNSSIKFLKLVMKITVIVYNHYY